MSRMAATTRRRSRRQFSDEFRAGAVRLVLEEGKTVGAVARELDLTESALRPWVERARADRSGGRTGLTTAEREELARLRKENRILAEERNGLLTKVLVQVGHHRSRPVDRHWVVAPARDHQGRARTCRAGDCWDNAVCWSCSMTSAADQSGRLRTAGGVGHGRAIRTEPPTPIIVVVNERKNNGNVPDYDIVATGGRGRTALVQVKAIAGPSWQFDIRTFADSNSVAKLSTESDQAQAATFAGNVPDYDIVATGGRGRTALVQVKAIAGPSWQFDIRTFADVRCTAGAQTIGHPTGDLICVFVRLHTYGTDHFYVLRWLELQHVLIDGYRSYLERHGGRRPRRADSFHTALREPQIKPFLDKWSLFNAFT